MRPGFIAIDNWQLAFAALLIVVNIAISISLKLGLARNLLVGSVRMVVQLLIVGFILEFVFALESPLPVIGIGLVMASLAGVSA
ncbi:MAG TPA: ABC transporter permease, partial [Pseudomonadales bacterium]|nr:ABC transporter permease [Pseudomonadales bacterium]